MQKDHHKKLNKNTQQGDFFNACLIRGPNYYNYENYEVQETAESDMYEIIEKIGRGKYSDVYKSICTEDDEFSVLKILKPVRPDKIRREIKILKSLDHPNIIKLQHVIIDQVSGSYCLAFDFVNTLDYRYLYDELEPDELRTYIYQILKGLQHCHSKGIVHRDIKPQNLLFDHENRHVKIADWGLADYFLPEKEYNVRVASRHYKGPQLLLNNKLYHYSLDIWSLGLVFAGFLFQVMVLFRGDSNPDQMKELAEHFGSEEVEAYIKKYRLKPDSSTQKLLAACKNSKRKTWDKYINKKNKHLCCKQAMDLLDKMLVVDHNQRISVLEALKHPYFGKIVEAQTE